MIELVSMWRVECDVVAAHWAMICTMQLCTTQRSRLNLLQKKVAGCNWVNVTTGIVPTAMWWTMMIITCL